MKNKTKNTVKKERNITGTVNKINIQLSAFATEFSIISVKNISSDVN